MKKKYDIIYSIGRDCACTMYMKSAKLRLTSGPFDWITNASWEQRFDLMMNDFNGFLDETKLKFLRKNPNVFNDDACDYYEHIENGFYFYHDFPINVPMADSLPEVREKYNRRIERFYHNIQKKNKVLLIFLSHYDHVSDNVIKESCDNFCKKMNKNIDFVIIEHKEGAIKTQSVKIAKNIEKYYLHTIVFDEQNLPTTLGNESEIRKIFLQYSLSLNHSFSKTIKHLLSKIICPFIPYKKWKKSVKSYLRS